MCSSCPTVAEEDWGDLLATPTRHRARRDHPMTAPHNEYVVWYQDYVEETDRPRVGGKNASLGTHDGCGTAGAAGFRGHHGGLRHPQAARRPHDRGERRDLRRRLRRPGGPSRGRRPNPGGDRVVGHTGRDPGRPSPPPTTSCRSTATSRTSGSPSGLLPRQRTCRTPPSPGSRTPTCGSTARTTSLRTSPVAGPRSSPTAPSPTDTRWVSRTKPSP